jgi:hypothetical protein
MSKTNSLYVLFTEAKKYYSARLRNPGKCNSTKLEDAIGECHINKCSVAEIKKYIKSGEAYAKDAHERREYY